ncbi:hypothetical protein GCM10007304_49040 [Rhodococcoides trifolii]|uniref:Uncharacterized protein n=1 Tax=Rhodococcoides trifolii TaxID=908250 RepID=A0A917G8Z8_9NOCA|nr:hypothetical protein [Rhodococcus trifolii]GGG29396.1 hypothetical protein GCM10007304_49040 [Rhodococcus trifolii]
MPLRNRVTPFGDIVESDCRGTIMGNRGVLHDSDRNIVRYSRNQAWITCSLEFKERRRPIMAPNRWTELFFLDEATALAAGHRPCAECRRPAFRTFQRLFDRISETQAPRAPVMDAKLATERRIRDSLPPLTFRAAAANLPSGTFVVVDGLAHLVLGEELLEWSPAGYTARCARPAGTVDVLTPKSTVRVLERGYRAAVHPSAT